MKKVFCDCDFSQGACALARCGSGTPCRLISVHGGLGFRGRLSGMGLVPGEIMTVVKNSFPGPLILEVKGTRLLLGAGMASRIRVEKVS